MNALQKLLAVRQLKSRFYNWDRGRLETHQRRQLAKVLSTVKANSAYYAGLVSGTDLAALHALPVMTKPELMGHFDEINTAGLQLEDLVPFAIEQERAGNLDLYQGRYSVGLSSGTSGNKGITVLTRDEMEMYSCLLWARCGIPDWVKKRRVLFLLRINSPAFMEVTVFGLTMVHADYTHPPEELAQLINDRQLNVLAGPPSLLSMIARHRHLIRSPVATLISYAEVLTDEAKERLERAFDAPVVQIYQGTEGFIGSTCREGRLHINEDIVLLELSDVDDRIGNAKKVILTDLYRTTVPFLRYSLNDIIEVSPDPCPCGSCFRVIERIHGREDDVFHLQGPTGETRYFFPDYVRRSINQASDAVTEYQAIQHAMDDIEIRLVLEPDADPAAVQRAILANLEMWAGRVGGELGNVRFTAAAPERNPRSQKLIRVVRAF